MFTDGPLAEKMREFEVCYLDNTYLHESFDKIPSRAEALKEIIEHIEHVRIVQDNTAIFFIKIRAKVRYLNIFLMIIVIYLIKIII